MSCDIVSIYCVVDVAFDISFLKLESKNFFGKDYKKYFFEKDMKKMK